MRLPSSGKFKAKDLSRALTKAADRLKSAAQEAEIPQLRRGTPQQASIDDITQALYESLTATEKRQRRLKSKTLWRELYGISRRTGQQVEAVSASLARLGISVTAKDAEFGREGKDDWLTLTLSPASPTAGSASPSAHQAESSPRTPSATRPTATSASEGGGSGSPRWPGAVDLPRDASFVADAPPMLETTVADGSQDAPLPSGSAGVEPGWTRLWPVNRPRGTRQWATFGCVGCGALVGICMLCTALLGLIVPQPATGTTGRSTTDAAPTADTAGTDDPPTQVAATEDPATEVVPSDTSVPATDTPPPPTATSIPPTSTPVPPSATPVPPTATRVPPTAAPPIDRDAGATLKCDDFPNYETMKAWRDYWIRRGVRNPGRLDGDGDGVACEDGEGGRPAPPPPPAPPVRNFSGAVSPQEPAPAPAQHSCCKVCNPGRSKACGDSCISLDKTCRRGPGCACDG